MTDVTGDEDAWPRTHRVAVGAYIFRDDRVLLVKRNHSPFTFAPPGGRLFVEEDPVVGLQREVSEETGLEIKLIGIARHWYGSMDGQKPPLLAVNFIAVWKAGEIRLSDEHSDYVWASRDDLETGRIATLNDDGFGYQPSDIIDAFERCARMRDLSA